jgi:molybdopterin converting factor subunit 1
MKVRVVFYGGLQHDTGIKQQTLELEQDSLTVRGLADLLAEQHPALRSRLGTVAYAVGNEIVEPGQPIRDGDEIALLPPVSGG